MVSICGMAGNRGRNLLNIDRERPGGAELSVIVTTSNDAPILDDAAARDIPTEVVPIDPDEARFAHEERIVDVLSSYDFDLVCLDGYMRILSSTFLDAMPPTLNVHPSLLPAFPGMDAWGDALDASVTVSGCTVHLVTDAVDGSGAVIEDEVDAGPIITQEPVPVVPGDTRETLKDRILTEGEFVAYPRAIEWIATGRVSLDGTTVSHSSEDQQFPHHRMESLDRHDVLRYGENPHQAAAVYRDRRSTAPSVVNAIQHTPDAKALSYNNYNDADAALQLIAEFDSPAAAVIKHTNPAGCATAETVADAYDRALATDPKSAFGGIVALNRKCDRETAAQIIDSFKEVVVAPSYTDAALETLRERENLRVLGVGSLDRSASESLHEKDLTGGRLIQEADTQRMMPTDLEIVTERTAPTETLESLCFAWQVCKHVKSNAIVFAQGHETVGIGAGQVSRVDAVELAAKKATRDAIDKDPEGAVMASDAFFPFPDGVETAAAAGIEAVIQPGGSKRDAAVIEAANTHDMVMAFTGTRSFRHD